MQTLHAEISRHLPHKGEARRLFHGRGHCFPGYEDVVIDSFSPVIMVMLYRQRPQAWLDALVELLLSLLPDQPEAVLLQERYHTAAPSRLLLGRLPQQVDALEQGLRYRLRLGEARNIGFFPDMAIGRKLVRERASGRRVLNLFAYSCSFSVAALRGGAEQVVNLDMNRGALELGKLNHQLNALDLRQASFLSMEFFKSLSKLRRLGPFDLVVCDPPAAQGKSFTAERHWPKLVRSLPALLSPGGELLTCLNAPDLGPGYLDNLLLENFPSAQSLGLYTPGEDFPEADPDRGVSLHHYRLPEAASGPERG